MYAGKMLNNKYSSKCILTRTYMIRFFEESVNSQNIANGALRK